MKLKKVKLFFGCFNCILFACGIIEVICGFLILSDSHRMLLSRLLVAPESGLPQPPLYYLALALLAVGLGACAVAALGCWATYMPGCAVLTIHFLLVLSLVLCECAGGAAAAVWPRCFGLATARGGAAGALQAYYGVPDHEPFTAAMDLAHTELECCGMTDARNFDLSLWQLRRLGPRGLAVPLSCCVQRAPASYLSPAPANHSRCQDLLPDPAFRHVPGCYQKLEDWYEQQYLIFLLSLFVAVVLKLGALLAAVTSCLRLRRARPDDQAYIMRSMDNKTNENIYESKLSGMRDMPIQAKYVQPNNFYSPRIRNPRLFYDKPNEMV